MLRWVHAECAKEVWEHRRFREHILELTKSNISSYHLGFNRGQVQPTMVIPRVLS